jgi:hypothetical protein
LLRQGTEKASRRRSDQTHEMRPEPNNNEAKGEARDGADRYEGCRPGAWVADESQAGNETSEDGTRVDSPQL